MQRIKQNVIRRIYNSFFFLELRFNSFAYIIRKNIFKCLSLFTQKYNYFLLLTISEKKKYFLTQNGIKKYHPQKEKNFLFFILLLKSFKQLVNVIIKRFLFVHLSHIFQIFYFVGSPQGKLFLCVV